MRTYKTALRLTTGALALAMLSSCAAATEIPAQPTVLPTPSPAPTEAAATPAPAPTQTEEGSARENGAVVALDLGDLAQGTISEVIAGVPPGPDKPWWEMLPQHTRLTLQGYPVADHRMAPQIFVFPVEGLVVSEYAQAAAGDLQDLLADQKAGQELPYLPPYNEAQALIAQVDYLDFKNGQGVRFLTEYGQGPVPINNRDLLYTFQGLTGDGKYYVAVVLPVNLAGLPADGTLASDLPSDYAENYLEYRADTLEMLEKQPAAAYTPDLSLLDALVQSIEINS